MITTVVIDEVHNRSAHSHYVLALTLAAMQKTPDLRLVLMCAVKRYFLAQPMERSVNMLNMIAQIVISYHNDRAGQPLVADTCHSKDVNSSNKIMVFLPGLAQIHQFCEILRGLLILVG